MQQLLGGPTCRATMFLWRSVLMMATSLFRSFRGLRLFLPRAVSTSVFFTICIRATTASAPHICISLLNSGTLCALWSGTLTFAFQHHGMFSAVIRFYEEEVTFTAYRRLSHMSRHRNTRPFAPFPRYLITTYWFTNVTPRSFASFRLVVSLK